MVALAPLTGDTMGGEDFTAAARGGVVGIATVRDAAPLSSFATFTSEAVASTLVCGGCGGPSRPPLDLAALSCRSRRSSSARRRSPSSARLGSSWRAWRSSPLRRLSSSRDSFARASDVSRRGSGERREGERREGERREGERREEAAAGLERRLLRTRGELERREDLVRGGEAERLRLGDARERGERERRSRRGEGERVRWLAALV